MKRICMIAGPNGAGKTTVALELVTKESSYNEFINADEIAKGLAPLNPESMALTASKLMIQRLKELLETDMSFAFETTAAGTNYVRHLKQAKSKGYAIDLTFLWLENPDVAVKRVRQRVKQGGHNIPEDSIRRRYYLGIKNLLTQYLPLADYACIVDNSLDVAPKKIIAMKTAKGNLEILDMKIWSQLEQVAYER
jgi:predicted ABC-type ATPase